VNAIASTKDSYIQMILLSTDVSAKSF